MKRYFFVFSILCIIFSCTSSKNSDEFITATEGKYLFNSDESIEVYFEDQEMRVKWRGKDMKPIKASDSAFYLRDMNEKMVFVAQPEMHIKLAPKREHEGKTYNFPKMKQNEKTPSEYFTNKEYKKALAGYLAIQKRDSLDPTINWWSINQRAHDYLDSGKSEVALELFDINTQLYPKKPAVFRNYGYAFMEIQDTVNAVKNYKIALSINPDDQRAIRFLDKIKKAKND